MALHANGDDGMGSPTPQEDYNFDAPMVGRAAGGKGGEIRECVPLQILQLKRRLPAPVAHLSVSLALFVDLRGDAGGCALHSIVAGVARRLPDKAPLAALFFFCFDECILQCRRASVPVVKGTSVAGLNR